jgi:hypothetical protein
MWLDPTYIGPYEIIQVYGLVAEGPIRRLESGGVNGSR